MADFSSTFMGGPQRSPITPQQPVDDNAGAAGVAAAANLATGALNLFTSVQSQKAQQATNQTVASFAQSQLDIADGVEQGAITASEGNLRLRANLNQAIANNPGLVDEFIGIQSKLNSERGMGKVVDEKLTQYQNDVNEARDNGFVLSGMSPEQVDAGVQDWYAVKAEQARIDREQNRVALETAQTNQTKSQMDLNNAITKQNAQEAMRNISGPYTRNFGERMNKITTDLEQGKLTREEATRLIDQEWAIVTAAVNQVGVDAGGDYLQALTKPMQMLYENTQNFVSGKTTLDALNAENNTAIALQKNLILQSPEDAQLVALSQLYGHSQALIGPVSASVTNRVRLNSTPTAKTADPMPNTPEERKDMADYLNLIKANMKSDLDESGKAELDMQVSNTLKGVDVHSLSVEDPTEFNQVVEFFADPTFYSYVSSRGGIPADLAAPARQVIQSEYETQVIPLIREEYLKSFTGGVDTRRGRRGRSPSPELIQAEFLGGGVVFTSTSKEPGVDFTLRNLNKNVAPVVNRLVRMDAHLSGSSNYKSSYESNYADLFTTGGDMAEGTPPEQPQQELVAGDDVSAGRIQRGFEELVAQGFTAESILNVWDSLGLADNSIRRELEGRAKDMGE